MKIVLTPLAKIVLIPLGLSAGMSAADAAIQKKICGSGTTVLVISNEEMKENHLNHLVKSLDESGSIAKEISKTIKNEAKKQKGKFITMLLGTLAASILGNALAEKGVIRASQNYNTTSSFN